MLMSSHISLWFYKSSQYKYGIVSSILVDVEELVCICYIS